VAWGDIGGHGLDLDIFGSFLDEDPVRRMIVDVGQRITVVWLGRRTGRGLDDLDIKLELVERLRATIILLSAVLEPDLVGMSVITWSWSERSKLTSTSFLVSSTCETMMARSSLSGFELLR
jgi:hypothetical protein